MSEILPQGQERDAALVRLAQLEGKAQECENRIAELSGEIEAVRARVKPQMRAVNDELSPVMQEIDDLRARLFPRMGIG